MLKLQGIYTVPLWCLCYLANGDWDHMTEEEKKLVDDWYDREFPNGAIFDFTNESYFYYRNDITGNTGCDVVQVIAYI